MIPPYKDVHPTLPPFHEWVDKPFIFSVVLGEARPYDFQQMEACVGEASSPTRPWQKKINFPSRLTWFEKPLKPDSHSKGRNVPWRNPESGRKTGDSELVLLSGNSWTGSRYQVARLGSEPGPSHTTVSGGKLAGPQPEGGWDKRKIRSVCLKGEIYCTEMSKMPHAVKSK